jgi:hypothetical protein
VFIGKLRFVWNGDTRATQLYRNSVELATAATAKREELIAAGWVDAPPHWKIDGGSGVLGYGLHKGLCP